MITLSMLDRSVERGCHSSWSIEPVELQQLEEDALNLVKSPTLCQGPGLAESPSLFTSPIIGLRIFTSFAPTHFILASSHSITSLYLVCLLPSTCRNALIANLSRILVLASICNDFFVVITYHSTCTLLTAHLNISFCFFLVLLLIIMKAKSMVSRIVSAEYQCERRCA